MGLKDWLEDQKEIKAVKKEAYEDEKDKADAEKHRKALDDAKIAGKEKAHTGFQLPKPNPDKINGIKNFMSGIGEKSSKAHERMQGGDLFAITGEKGKGMSSGMSTPDEEEPEPVKKRTVSAKKRPVTRKVKSGSVKKKPVSVEKMTPEDKMDDYNKRMKETLGY